MTGQPVPSRWQRLISSPLLHPLNDLRAIDDLLQAVVPSWSLREIRARVVSARRETPDARTLVLEPNRWWPGHVAGQHVQVTADIDGRRLVRTFSISSPPRADGLVHVTVKRRDGGKVSSWWNDTAKVGDVVTLSKPAGTFVLPSPSPGRIMMISAGSGITPVMAMLRALVEEHVATNVLLVHAARSPRDVLFAHELRAITQKHPNIELRLHLSSERRRLEEMDFAKLALEAGDAPAFVCGPPSLLQATQRAWSAAGLATNLRFEWFGAPLPIVDGRRPHPAEATRASCSFVVAPGESLLVAAERAGLRPAYGCRVGVCHTCKCRKISGVTEDLRDGRVSTEPGELIQLCISTARSPVTLEL